MSIETSNKNEEISNFEQSVWNAIVDIDVNSSDSEIVERTIKNLDDRSRLLHIKGLNNDQKEQIKNIITDAGPEFFKSARDSYFPTKARWNAMKEITKLIG